jgi:hypothetical protein
MPDVYIKGRPHTPMSDVTGHFIGMRVPEWPSAYMITELWWRADEVNELVDDLKQAEERIRLLKDQVIDLTAATQRRPPKRARRPEANGE